MPFDKDIDPGFYGKRFFGFEVRQPFDQELRWFTENPETAGMATEDNRIILNPYSNLNKKQKEAVIKNEASRLHMRSLGVVPPFELTKEQIESFRGTPYEGNLNAIKETIVGRIVSGDKSAGKFTPEQKAFADNVLRHMKLRY